MSVKGFLINGSVVKYDYNSLDNKPVIPTGTGISDDLKAALLQLAEKVAYIDANGSDYYQDLYEALYNDPTYTVTNNLTDVTNSNAATRVTQGGSYSATLTAASGYTINSVTVTMGGNDVTGTAYSSGTISIANVTGNIVITAVATQRQATLLSITATFSQGSAVIFDDASLDSLKQYLTVTANYDDSSSETLADSVYTLSGTLTAGTSTITASYNNLTASFDVTVSHNDTSLYNWDFTKSLTDSKNGVEAILGNGASRSANGITFDGTAGACWVSLANMSAYSKSSFTVELDVTSWSGGNGEPQIIGLVQNGPSGERCGIRYATTQWRFYDTSNNWRTPTQVISDISYFNNSTLKFVCDYKNAYWAVYKDGILAFDYTGVLSRSNNRDLVLIGTAYSYDAITNGSVITGARIYEGVV